eukprot:5402324-Pyramimonas_sp.AAC.1
MTSRFPWRHLSAATRSYRQYRHPLPLHMSHVCHSSYSPPPSRRPPWPPASSHVFGVGGLEG